MKKLKLILSLPVFIAVWFSSCNNSTGSTTREVKKHEAVTDIPVSTKSKDALASFHEALAALDLNDIKKARVALNKAVGQDPDLGIAYLYKAGVSTSAKEYVDNVNTGRSKTASASNWEKLYGDYMSTNLSEDRNKGLEIMKQIATTYPDAARAQADLGNAYSGNNQFDKARELFQKAIHLDPKWPGGYTLLVNSYLFYDPKDLKKGEANALKIVELAPASAGAEITLGDCYRAQSDFQKAKEAYAKAIQLDPTAPDAFYKEGHANVYLGNYAEARKNYADAGRNDISKTIAYLNTAFSYLYENNPKAALSFLMDAAAKSDTASTKSNADLEKSNYLNACMAISIHNGDAATLKKLSPMLLQVSEQINNQLGTPEAKIFIETDKLNLETLIAYTEGKYDEAKAKNEALKAAFGPIKDDRKLEGYYYNMGLISMKQKDYAGAIAQFEKTDPTSIYNKYLLAKANKAAGNKEKATALFKEVAAYNFSDVGNALIRNDVKKELATP